MQKAKWTEYYELESLEKNFLPEEDPKEIDRVRFACTLMPSEKISSLMDVGCGNGYFCSIVYKRIPIVAGMDISEHRVLDALERFPEIEFKKASAYNLPYKDNSYFIVTAIEVIEHLEDITSALREFKRVSNKYILITVPYKQVIQKVICPYCLKMHNLDGHLHSFDRKRILNECRKAGLKPIVVERYRIERKFEILLNRCLPKFVVNLIKKILNNIGIITEDCYKYVGVLCEK